MKAIICRDIHKRYGDYEAVRGVGFEVGAGEIFALLGRNGAGKTTTVELLAGFGRPDRGEIDVRGETGIMLQEAGFLPGLTVGQTIKAWSSFIPRPRGDVLDVTGLRAKEPTKVRQLSGGEKRRLDLALALLGRPEVLFLDEPTAGMDPEARRDTWTIIRRLAADGTTILLTTHYLDEAQRLASHIAIMDSGRLIANGELPEVLSGRAGRVTFTLPDRIALADLPVPDAELDGDTVVCRAGDPDEAAQRLLGWAAERGVRLRGLEVRPATLEDLFLEPK